MATKIVDSAHLGFWHVSHEEMGIGSGQGIRGTFLVTGSLAKTASGDRKASKKTTPGKFEMRRPPEGPTNKHDQIIRSYDTTDVYDATSQCSHILN